MSRTRCFFLEPTDTVRLSLRVARYDSECPMHPQKWWHQAYAPIGEAKAVFGGGDRPDYVLASRKEIAPDDPRWPSACHGCKEPFTKEDWRDIDQSLVYRRSDTGALLTRDEAPPGAMWFAPWYGDNEAYRGPRRPLPGRAPARRPRLDRRQHRRELQREGHAAQVLGAQRRAARRARHQGRHVEARRRRLDRHGDVARLPQARIPGGMMGQVIAFPARQRGHADLGGLIGIIVAIAGAVLTGGGLVLLWMGIRMLWF